MDVRFYTDPELFLHDAGPFMRADPVRCSVVATMAQRTVCNTVVEGAPYWFATLSDGGDIVALAMRTHPDPPHAGFVGEVSHEGAVALGQALSDRGEEVPAWNGDPAAGRYLCGLVADGRDVDVAMHLRLFSCHDVIWPTRPEGELRQATLEDEELVTQWSIAFRHDSDTQGGRTPRDWSPSAKAIRAAIETGGRWIWEVDGVPVHMTGVSAPAFGVARIGPVYTPLEHRGRGYAGWVVAHLSQQTLDAGVIPCLYTDQANPVSNKVYERIGYRAIRDEANIVVQG